MNSAQQNKLSMYLAVLGVMEKFHSAWSALTGIANMVTRLQGCVTQLGEKTGIQGTPQTGVAGGKNRKNLSMIQLASDIAGDLHSLAISRGDDVMAAKMDLHLSDLVHLGNTVVGPRCQEIHDLAETNAADLTSGFNTDAVADTAALQAAIDAYSPLVGTPRQAKGVTKEATKDIQALEESADALLKDELDRSMRKQKKKNPQFFGEYSSARMIINLGTRHEKTTEGTTTTVSDATPPPARA